MDASILLAGMELLSEPDIDTVSGDLQCFKPRLDNLRLAPLRSLLLFSSLH